MFLQNKASAVRRPNSISWSLTIAGTLFISVVASANEPQRSIYPKQQFLIEPTELRLNDAKEARVILDTREKEKYVAGHIPTSVWVDAGNWSKAVSEDRNPENWTQRFGEIGLDKDEEVVVYDDQRLRGAARIWWILRLWGVRHVRVLNGGWEEYVQSDRPVENGTGTTPKHGDLTATREDRVLATKDLLLAAHRTGRLGKAGAENLQIVDTRSTAEYCGSEPSRAKKTGTIPGARHLEWSDVLVSGTSRLKNPDELKSLFAEAKIDVDQPAVTFCQGGGRAAVMAFVLTVMGSPEARNYYASWGEWGNADDTPVELAYARPELIIEPAELQTATVRPGKRLVLDVRSAKEFEEQHYKGAHHINLADWTKDFGDGQDTELWNRRIGQSGIGRDTEVIVYDDRLNQDAARAWW
jgi:thiosulfate/3-mercaptopyruvate sulfurtransferase